MNRVITVKGIGNISVKPDLIVLELCMETRHAEYSKCMKLASRELESLRRRLTDKNFADDALKTTDFGITAEYRHVKDTRGDYHDVFDTWRCGHSLKLEFPLDLERLSEVISAIGKSDAPPKLTVRFAVADGSRVGAELLKSATGNARRKAEILCDASHVKLGDLLSINYDWAEFSLYSNTEYTDGRDLDCCINASMHIDPEDVKVRDTVAFVWEIS